MKNTVYTYHFRRYLGRNLTRAEAAVIAPLEKMRVRRLERRLLVVDPSGVTKPNGKVKQIAETKAVLAIFVIPLSGKMTHIIGFRGVQFVNSQNREQFVHDDNTDECNSLTFCVFLRFVNLKVGFAYSPQGSKPHFSGIMS